MLSAWFEEFGPYAGLSRSRRAVLMDFTGLVVVRVRITRLAGGRRPGA